jgi:hypothetical protein
MHEVPYCTSAQQQNKKGPHRRHPFPSNDKTFCTYCSLDFFCWPINFLFGWSILPAPFHFTLSVLTVSQRRGAEMVIVSYFNSYPRSALIIFIIFLLFITFHLIIVIILYPGIWLPVTFSFHLLRPNMIPYCCT